MSNFENRIQKDLVTDAILTESIEDFILPDYMPEISRVLRVSSSLSPDECYLGSDGAEFSGRVEYRLLYSDGEGTITEAPLEGRYRYRIPSGERKILCAYTDEQIESVSTRPSAPRKLNIRSRISARAHLLYEESVGTSLASMVGDAEAEMLTEKKTALRREAHSYLGRHAEDRFTLEDVSADALSLISVEGAVLPEGIEAHEGYFSVRGKLVCSVILQTADGTPMVKEYAIPFSEELPAEGAHSGDAVTLRAFCDAPVLSFEEDGENTLLSLGGDYSLFCVLYRNESFPVLKDFYVLGAHHEIKRRTQEGESLIGCFTGNLSIVGDVLLPDDISPDALALSPRFTVKELHSTVANDRGVLEGSLLTSLLVPTENGERSEVTLPFRVEIPLGGRGTEKDSLFAFASPVGGSARIGGGRIHLCTELAVSACALHNYTVSIPYAATALPAPDTCKAGEVTVYYPTDGDTLWSVGKRYAVAQDTIKKQNGIPQEEDTDPSSTSSLDGYAYLLFGAL